eukprot:1898013-Rhodomonas_salina.1
MMLRVGARRRYALWRRLRSKPRTAPYLPMSSFAMSGTDLADKLPIRSYAMSGTDIANRYFEFGYPCAVPGTDIAMSGTEVVHGATSLCTCYAMPGTEIRYARAMQSPGMVVGMWCTELGYGGRDLPGGFGGLRDT